MKSVAFQKLLKECPGLAAEFAAISIRVNKLHYGTLNKYKGEFQAEFREECVAMLPEIEKIVQPGSEICNEL